MNKTNHQITAEDARVALKSLKEANSITANSMRPPLWLILLCSVALGIKTIAMGLMINNSLWHSVQWVSYIAICLSMILWIVALRVKGIRVRIVDINVAKTAIIPALLICTLLVASRVAYLQTGSILFPSIAGIFNTGILAFSIHFGLRLNATEKVNHNE